MDKYNRKNFRVLPDGDAYLDSGILIVCDWDYETMNSKGLGGISIVPLNIGKGELERYPELRKAYVRAIRCMTDGQLEKWLID